MLHNLIYFCNIQKHTLHVLFYRFSFCAIFYFRTSFCQALNLLFLKSDHSIGRQYVVLLELVISVSFLKIYESGDQNYIWKGKEHEKLNEISQPYFYVWTRNFSRAGKFYTKVFKLCWVFFTVWILNFKIIFTVHYPIIYHSGGNKSRRGAEALPNKRRGFLWKQPNLRLNAP